MGRKTTFISILILCTSAAHAAPRGEAPRNGMTAGGWSSGIKQAVGTSFEAYDRSNQYSGQSPTAPISKVWFTAAQGILTETFWPTVDTAQVKDSQILATDGTSFFYEERKDSETQVTWLNEGVPAYHVINRERRNRFQIERTIFTDPDRDVVYQRVRIISNMPGLKFFLLHKPNVGNTPMDDTAMASTGGANLGAGLYAAQTGQAQALLTSVPFKQASAGFVGASDGWSDIKQDLKMDRSYATASRGNVVLTAWLDLPETRGAVDFDLALGFGSDPATARALAEQSLRIGAQALLSKYTSQWQSYQSSIRNLNSMAADRGRLFRSSVAVIKSMEDKTFEGAFVAAPLHPWGDHLSDNSSGNNPTAGGYHLVWPRDLYHMATAFLAVDDLRSAVASLNYLRTRQLSARDGEWVFGSRRTSKDGSFYQNFYVNGRGYWTGLQMDETALPVVLAYRLWERGAIQPQAYWDFVRRGADFIQRFGPWSPQERWEENMGASPSTIASEIAALVVASKFAEQMGDRARAQLYLDTARAWANKPGDNIDTWTFTTNSRHGRHYVRVEGAATFDQTWNPNDDWMFFIANNGGRWAERDVVDQGFLELVRFGIRNPNAQTMLDSVAIVDRTIRSDLPGIGPGFHRYSGDMYNYDSVTGQQTPGMPWPILTGERGHYELARALESRRNPDAAVVPYIQTMERMATPEMMIPEQVWKAGPGMGKSTGAATPLGWAHGEYIKLLRSRAERNVFDRIGLVRSSLGTR